MSPVILGIYRCGCDGGGWGDGGGGYQGIL